MLTAIIALAVVVALLWLFQFLVACVLTDFDKQLKALKPSWKDIKMAEPPRTKEEVYDARISPLMAQIIAICREHKIAHVCAFTLDVEEGLCCISANTSEGFEPEERLLAAARALYRNPQTSTLTIRDGDGNAKEIVSILS